jgi:hypothetical protein
MKKFKMEKTARLASKAGEGPASDIRRIFDPDLATRVQPRGPMRQRSLTSLNQLRCSL